MNDMTPEEMAREDIRFVFSELNQFYESTMFIEAIEDLIDARVQRAITEAIDGLQANGYIPV